MFRKFLPVMPLALFLVPALAAAQSNIQGILGTIRNLLNLLVPIIMGLAVIYFLWELVNYLSKQGDDDARKDHRNKMIYAIIVLAVMVGVWGLVSILLNTFGISPGTGPLPIPDLPR